MRLFATFLALVVLAASSCSLPSLEDASCAAGRESVRQFYAFHIAHDGEMSAEDLEKRRSFLTAKLAASALPVNQTADYFSGGGTTPRAFRVGECTAISDDRATVNVLLFWREDGQSTQRSVEVETVREADKWLLDRISY